AYAIGVPDPVSVMIDTFETGKVEEAAIAAAVRKVFQLDPAGIIASLELKKPVYRKTASYGHFGREGFSWERTDKAEALARAL
ncbi:MAG TPA: methionine adenosyltransferase domain-containing protein, partial [Spirochaetia bacterium]|nr:methionine adenosyltransferase domain-containing protein [Spirochaetia bacterium]